MNVARLWAPLLAAALGATALAGCDDAGASPDGKTPVVASFYPLAYAAERVGGAFVDVTSLTPPGAEPHDVELSPKEAAAVSDASLAVYAKGFQPSVDAAVKLVDHGNVLNVASAADLDLSLDSVTTIGGKDAESGSGTDPHFWLDPVRYAAVVGVIAKALQQRDPAHAAAYGKNAAAFQRELAALDTSFARGLAHCRNTSIVTSHAAFGYLAQRYHLRQVGVTGVSPEQEPTPGRLRDVTTYVKDHQVSTIYTETLASPAVARAVATQTGARVAVLDPIEGVTEASAGHDYLTIMRANLATLRAGQECS
ncbi:zinc ABC transporter substrate-binding protein [Calidifontibacter sp. DB0510]|uniref:Zinc ABC transporter substrate-binding protein n=1 Tax=Metallococcus carri TaxID=1656884 RepID=A0A967EGB4_9MICO|nr:metal ABC transporter substrate-binding protein [Metallococcus carri]NHN57421.1 zinc ABC transporter substrate-binding protein [Metallococcus carri]NOP39183.1 zinc ABC transporter substrate-binding protein [Calidifontibacter sp. DB2511S]